MTHTHTFFPLEHDTHILLYVLLDPVCGGSSSRRIKITKRTPSAPSAPKVFTRQIPEHICAKKKGEKDPIGAMTLNRRCSDLAGSLLTLSHVAFQRKRTLPRPPAPSPELCKRSTCGGVICGGRSVQQEGPLSARFKSQGVRPVIGSLSVIFTDPTSTTFNYYTAKTFLTPRKSSQNAKNSH
jgi:hypothetical protein